MVDGLNDAGSLPRIVDGIDIAEHRLRSAPALCRIRATHKPAERCEHRGPLALALWSVPTEIVIRAGCEADLPGAPEIAIFESLPVALAP